MTLAAVGAPLSAQARDTLGLTTPRSALLLVGTFHFDDAGRDAYRPRFAVDVRSPERQSQLADLVERLASFRPTRVAVESPRERQGQLDSAYATYLRGGLDDRPNEMYQVGFRLARRMGHTRVYAVDAQPDSVFYPFFARAERVAGGDTIDAALGAGYRRLYARDDSLKTIQTLREHLRYINSPERIRLGHGAYEVGLFKLADDSGYLGADLRAAWYDRNLRIYRNLLRLADPPGERVLLLIGSGHLAILRFLAASSPVLSLEETTTYLR